MSMILHFSADLVCQQNSCTPLNCTGVRKVHSIHYNSPVKLTVTRPSFHILNKISATLACLPLLTLNSFFPDTQNYKGGIDKVMFAAIYWENSFCRHFFFFFFNI